MRLESLPHLGAGIGFREPFRGELFLSRGSVDFLEITADHYLAATPEKLAELDLLAEHFTLVPHCLDLSLGSAEGLDDAYVEALAALIERIDPPWWSEHVAFTRAGGVSIGHLASLPFTREAARIFARNVARVRERIAKPLIVENITYTVVLPGAELTEAEFLTEIVERSDCGLLLDVTNVHVNSTNHGFDPLEFLEALPLERVVQLHFVGVEERDGVLIDSHARPTPEPVWEIMGAVADLMAARGVQARGAILERDENLPAFGELLGELERARQILSRPVAEAS